MMLLPTRVLNLVLAILITVYAVAAGCGILTAVTGDASSATIFFGEASVAAMLGAVILWLQKPQPRPVPQDTPR